VSPNEKEVINAFWILAAFVILILWLADQTVGI